MKQWVVTNDWQIPFHDKPAVELFMRFVENLRPHGLVWNGDIVDCYALSKFSKNPIGPASLDIEIRYARKFMDRLSKVTTVRWWLGGNHEDRLRKHIWNNPDVFNVLEKTPERYQFPSLFGLQHYGFSWKNYGEAVWLGKLLVTHGSIVRKHSAESARSHYLKYGVPIMIGHTHRLGAYYHTDLSGPAVALENGCLCRLDPEYDPNPDWQQGFSIVTVDDTKTKFFHVEQVPILKRSLLLYGGEIFK